MSTSIFTGRNFRRCFALLALFGAQHAVAEPPPVTLEVSATDPASEATMQRGEAFYVRVAYHGDEPLRIRVTGLWQGGKKPSMTNPSPRSDPPGGEAMVWLAFDTAAMLDEVQVTAEDQATGQVVARTSLPVKLEWTGVPAATPRQVADWAADMSRAQQHTVSREMRATSASGSFASTLLILVIVLSLPGYAIVQIWSLKRLRGAWRKAAFIPLWMMGAALAVSVFALFAGSNLWPIWLILLAPLALIWLVAIILVHRSTAAA